MKKIKLFTIIFVLLCTLCSCKKQVDLTEYISEYKSNIFYGKTDEYTIFASISEKETPFVNDGICGDISSIFEIKLYAPTNVNSYSILFNIEGNEYGGELAFDSIKQCFKYSQTLVLSSITEIKFFVSNNTKETQINTLSVLPTNALTKQAIISIIQVEQKEKIDSLTTKKTFSGEIQIRLLYEDEKCYFYVGVVDKEKETNALLIDAITGKVIATKTIKN